MIQVGDKVSWTYRHQLNSRQYTYVTKEGEVLSVNPPMAKVQFKGNKHPAKKRIIDLKKL